MLDKLSGLLERKAFLAKMEEELKRSVRYRRPFGFLMMDIAHNHFTQERDVRWSMGYSLLKQLAAVLKTGLRDVDVLGRFEGEIFGAALPETDVDGAKIAAERVRQAVADHWFMGTTQEDRVQIARRAQIFGPPQQVVELGRPFLRDMAEGDAGQALGKAGREAHEGNSRPVRRAGQHPPGHSTTVGESEILPAVRPRRAWPPPPDPGDLHERRQIR